MYIYIYIYDASTSFLAMLVMTLFCCLHALLIYDSKMVGNVCLFAHCCSLRAQFSVEDVPLNQLHGSDSVESASHELEYFFPMEQTVAMIKPDGIGSKGMICPMIA